MKSKVKLKLLGGILSDGSFHFSCESGVLHKSFRLTGNLDVINHFVWTGRGPKEQTEIANFVVRFHK